MAGRLTAKAEAKAEARAPEAEPPLGKRLRARRQGLGLTLKEVADDAGLSVGFISQVERGIATPSISSLAGIARGLGAHITEFLSQPKGDTPFTLHGERSRYSVAPPAGLQYERISASFPGSVLNSVIIHEPPGYRTEPIRHEGEELFFLLDGEITVEVESRRTILKAGDSIHFSSGRRHSVWNHGARPAVVLHVCTMDVFGDREYEPRPPGSAAGPEEGVGARAPATPAFASAGRSPRPSRPGGPGPAAERTTHPPAERGGPLDAHHGAGRQRGIRTKNRRTATASTGAKPHPPPKTGGPGT